MSSTAELLDAAVAAIGGTSRPGQGRMAEAVDKALEGNRHLAVQAGTGTGKSLAYLVPAVRHAMATGTTVIVSTATLALQRQLVKRDLPRLVEALTPLLDRAPTFAMLKGRSNYVCLHKVAKAHEEAEPELDVSPTGKLAVRLFEWAEETDSGDRDDLDVGVPNFMWSTVSTTSTDCLGARACPHGADCFAELARRNAQDVDIVVTNHAMLAIDAVSGVNILPEHDAVIVDEAHELDDRITSISTEAITARALKLAHTRVQKFMTEPRLSELADEFVTVMREQPAGRWTDLPVDAKGHLAAIADACLDIRSQLSANAPSNEEATDPERHAEREVLGRHLAGVEQAIARMLDVFSTGEHHDVVWLERDGSTDAVTVAPISVAPLLQDTLFEDNTVILTSATLALGGRFEAMAAQWGLPQSSFDGMDVGTPFEPKKSGILYTAAHLPPPGRDGLAPETLEDMRELIMAAGGRTLGLFSSQRAATQAAEELRPLLPFDVFVQGEDSIGALVTRFSNNENSCLFGTLSLWQGVDVPGSACSLVIIDRIPFPRPDDPLVLARTEAVKARGGNGFMEVSASHAALLMAQGAGRLLRTVTDRGVVAVMDSRLVTKRYGNYFLKSMPDFWTTTDPEVVRGALRRLVAP